MSLNRRGLKNRTVVDAMITFPPLSDVCLCEIDGVERGKWCQKHSLKSRLAPFPPFPICHNTSVYVTVIYLSM